jgi:hypothetical protein
MNTFIEIDTTPFTTRQLRYFRREIEKAGGTDELMLKKEALKIQDGRLIIAKYNNKEKYKEKFLTGIYASLSEHYDTLVPYVFWNRLYEMLRKVNPKFQ